MELRIQILFNIDDPGAVKSLVSASPEYHQAYQIIRHDLLFMHLQKSYDGLVDIQDAVAAIRSRGMYAVYPSNREKIIALLDARRRSDEIRHLKYSRILPDMPASVDEIIQLLHLHNTAMFLLSDYGTNAECPKWMEPSEWHSEILPLQLSRLEKRRIIRAFYRLQIYGNIFGNIELSLGAQQPPEKENEWQGNNWDTTNYKFTDEEVWSLFMAPMAPWEVEELGCFWKYCFNRLEKPYMEIADSLLNSGTMFISELPTHEQPPFKRYYYDTDDLHVKEWENRVCFLSIGPTFLSKVLRELDFMTRRNLVYVNSLGNDHVFTHFWPRPRRNYGTQHCLFYTRLINSTSERILLD